MDNSSQRGTSSKELTYTSSPASAKLHTRAVRTDKNGRDLNAW